ncbi:hypothetical protein N7489_009966 [Penicillium chrysogenum]|uniref:uncharacterized protein n=1 Tax=Penicillium chrysogenum TaxID=5076 RepID=UPI0024DF1D35|nr:uncharacterized protein N7489_009966 [Penicillium chrysogenum]KAJ5229258.1 hypothetical protein N7489_009966 [Penicillium chrysogenum]
MASVYKSVSKKAARQPTEDVSDEDMEMEELLNAEDDTTDSEEEESDDGEAAEVVKKQLASGFMPKTRVLILTSRGASFRHRHLMSDICGLLPHAHKETKLDTKKKAAGYNLLLNSLADLHSCNFHLNNLHTMGELGAGFAGNCLKGGRGLVVFDRSFDEQGPDMGAPGSEYRALVREMLRGVFCVPKRGVRGMKPFIDRIIGIFGVDGKIWIRVYEIRESEAGKKKDGDETIKPVPKGKDNSLPEVSLVEIGPRFVLTPIVILEGSFGGPVIYENKEYVSPNQVRSDIRRGKAGRYSQRRDGQTDRVAKRSDLGLSENSVRKVDALDTRKLFA